MKNNGDIFKQDKKSKNRNPNLKYIVISFSAFILILSLFSALIFMRSIDFDFNNIVDRTTESDTEGQNTDNQNIYSVSDLSGKRDLLFILTDDSGNANYGFVINTDFDSKSMSVRAFDASAALSDGKTYASLYKGSFVSDLKTRINSDYSCSIDKYIICTPTQFKKIIAMFGGVTVNVAETVNYKSSEFTVNLEQGKQKLSDEYVYKYLAVSDIHEKARIMCDIINSVLTPEYSNKSDELFRIFVNNCTTDISVIDYSNAYGKIKIYSNSEDKFYPYSF